MLADPKLVVHVFELIRAHDDGCGCGGSGFGMNDMSYSLALGASAAAALETAAEAGFDVLGVFHSNNCKPRRGLAWSSLAES